MRLFVKKNFWIKTPLIARKTVAWIPDFLLLMVFTLHSGWGMAQSYQKNAEVILGSTWKDHQFYSLREAFFHPQEVYELDLSNQHHPILPPEILQLTELKSLILNNCQISRISEALTLLPQLKILSLRNNDQLDLGAAFQVIRRMPYLEVLYLDSCRIEHLPEALGDLPEIRYLSLSHNQLRELPEALFRLHTLRSLNLSYNLLEQIPKEISLFTQLTSLNLTANLLPSIPTEINELARIEELGLGLNYIRQISLNPKRLTNLKVVSLLANPIPDAEKNRVRALFENTDIIF